MLLETINLLVFKSMQRNIVMQVSIGMVGGIISTPWLKTLLFLHRAPINVIVYDEITHT